MCGTTYILKLLNRVLNCFKNLLLSFVPKAINYFPFSIAIVIFLSALQSVSGDLSVFIPQLPIFTLLTLNLTSVLSSNHNRNLLLLWPQSRLRKPSVLCAICTVIEHAPSRKQCVFNYRNKVKINYTPIS